MINNIKSVRHNAVMNGLLSISQIIFPLITFPYISRTLGVEANGQLSFANSCVSYFSLFATVGLTTYGIKACAKVREDKVKLSRTVHELLLINLVTTGTVFLIMMGALLIVPRLKQEFDLILIYSLTMLLNVAGLNWFYSGIENYDFITIRSVAFKIISLGLMFIFVHTPKDYYIYAGITVFASVGSNILNIVNARKIIIFKKLDSYNWRKHIKPTMSLFVISLAVNVYTNFNNIVLGFMTSDYQVGIYSTSIRIRLVLTSIITSVGAVLLPRLSYYIECNKKDDFIKVLKKSFSFTIFSSLPAALYFTIFAKESILLISGPEYLEAVLPMQILMFLIVCTGLSNILGIQILIPNNKESFYMKAAVYGAVANILLSIFLIPRYAAVGASISTLVAELVQLLVHLKYTKEYTSKIIEVKEVMKVFSSLILALVITMSINYFLNVHYFITLCVTGASFFSTYIIALWILDYKFLTNIIYQVSKGRVNRYGRDTKAIESENLA